MYEVVIGGVGAVIAIAGYLEKRLADSRAASETRQNDIIDRVDRIENKIDRLIDRVTPAISTKDYHGRKH